MGHRTAASMAGAASHNELDADGHRGGAVVNHRAVICRAAHSTAVHRSPWGGEGSPPLPSRLTRTAALPEGRRL